MTALATLRASSAFAELLEVSERMGRDPLQVQGPGGNTSLKRDGLMLVKASGTWLAEACEREIMVAVRSGDLRAALLAGDPAAEDASAFAVGEAEPGLRPSIETTVHAALDWPVALHTHCVATIATAARANAAEQTTEKLGDLGAVALPYIKPGVRLARAILERATPATRVLILGNHGLVVCGETAVEAEALAQEVARRLGREPLPGAAPAERFAAALEGTGWTPAPHPLTHAVARDPVRLVLAEGGSLYPDHVVFLGPGVVIARPGETTAEALERAQASTRKLVLVPGQGAAVPVDASPSVLAMTRAFGDVLARIDPGPALNRLSSAQEAELTNWDAEKHRQALEAARSRA